MTMPEFSDLFLELRTILDDPEAYYAQISSELDPNLIDELRAYAVARHIPLQDAILNALQLFMLSSAEEAWQKLCREARPEAEFSAAPLSIILERFLAIALDPARQKSIEGPELAPILDSFRRMPD
jgi:hypothetical protein